MHMFDCKHALRLLLFVVFVSCDCEVLVVIMSCEVHGLIVRVGCDCKVHVLVEATQDQAHRILDMVDSIVVDELPAPPWERSLLLPLGDAAPLPIEDIHMLPKPGADVRSPRTVFRRAKTLLDERHIHNIIHKHLRIHIYTIVKINHIMCCN